MPPADVKPCPHLAAGLELPAAAESRDQVVLAGSNKYRSSRWTATGDGKLLQMKGGVRALERNCQQAATNSQALHRFGLSFLPT